MILETRCSSSGVPVEYARRMFANEHIMLFWYVSEVHGTPVTQSKSIEWKLHGLCDAGAPCAPQSQPRAFLNGQKSVQVQNRGVLQTTVRIQVVHSISISVAANREKRKHHIIYVLLSYFSTVAHSISGPWVSVNNKCPSRFDRY